MEEAANAATARRKAIGKRIADARRAKRWKQKNLAAAVNVEPLTVSRWERGQHTPTLDMFDLIAEATGVPVCDLLGEPIQPAELDAGAATEVQQRLAALERGREEDRVVLDELLRLALAEQASRQAAAGEASER